MSEIKKMIPQENAAPKWIYLIPVNDNFFLFDELKQNKIENEIDVVECFCKQNLDANRVEYSRWGMHGTIKLWGYDDNADEDGGPYGVNGLDISLGTLNRLSCFLGTKKNQHIKSRDG